jgi:hypothetical protein
LSFILKGLQNLKDSTFNLSGIGVIGLSITLSGIVISLTKINGISHKKQLEFVCICQKFLMVSVLLIFAIISIFMIDKGLNGINVDSIIMNNPIDVYRGILFWTATPLFHGGVVLFLIGVSDLVFSLYGLISRPNVFER